GNLFFEHSLDYVTTSAIVLEFGNAFSPISLKSTAIQIIESINLSKKWRCIDVDKSLFDHGFKRYKSYLDKDWGLVDCISMIVAIELCIIEIFTADKHFEQAGFKILLK
ncbi:MAG: nucleic acid-binding protein contains PIN domain-like protein, partial [Candidatus Magnetoglobus multicellularis str. Araruama]